MVARRLVIVMLVMLVISSLAAVLAPSTRRDGTTTEETTRERPPQRTQPSGRLVRATIDTSRGPRTVRIMAGDQLALVVRHRRPDGVEIPRLGQLEDVDAVSPARFDLLPPPGRYAVRLAEAGRRIGEVVVRAPGSRSAAAGKPARP
jgi:hypothetical protein